MNAFERKCLWQDSERFCSVLLDHLLRQDSRELLGADGWRALRAAFDHAVQERIERFEAWQLEEERELAALRESYESTLAALREDYETLERRLAASFAREGGAK